MASFVATGAPDGLLGMKLDDERYIALLRKLIGEVKGASILWHAPHIHDGGTAAAPDPSPHPHPLRQRC